MFRLTLAQMRRSAGRLAAAGIAIVIGTAFVALTLLAANAMNQAARATMAARYADADLVAQIPGASLTLQDLAAITALPGVAAADSDATSFQSLTSGGRTTFGQFIAVPSDPRLSPLQLEAGALPAASGEIALPAVVADRLEIAIGDPVTLDLMVLAADGAWTTEPTELLLVGTVADPHGAFSAAGGAGLATPGDIATWNESAGETRGAFGAILVALAPGASLPQVRSEIAQTLAVAHPEAAASEVMTPMQIADAAAASATGGANVTAIGLVFAAIALLVAGLVIANTFQVLLAQRTRTLALLRCVGADKGQLHRSVLLEAAILGLLASAAGLLVGIVLAWIALTIAPHFNYLDANLPTNPDITLRVLAVPLIVGTVVTLLAALAPARLATRVAPLAALRPVDAPTAAAGRVRLVAALLLLVGGFALLWRGVAIASAAASQGLLFGVLGGALSFIGVALSAVFWLPQVAGWFGALISRFGPTAKLAAANALRNPRRTAATATALLIGVTLVSMMSTAAVTAQRTLDSELDTRYPVDVSVDTDALATLGTPLDPSVRAVAVGHEGVAAVADVTTVPATLPTGSTVAARGIDPAAAAQVLHDPSQLAGLDAGTVVVPTWQGLGVTDGQELTLTGPSGSVTLRARLSDLRLSGVLVTPEAARALDANAQPTGLWVALDRNADALTTIQDLRDAVVDTGAVAATSGAAIERSELENVINTLLAVLLGLLAAAVLIALIGVANTLSLSVIERQRESATLRAIGLSRRALRGSLAIEGLLIAGVGTFVGILLGLGYGWAGAAIVFGSLGNMVVSVPWAQIGLVVVVALAAAVLASVLPGRTAANTPPVAALAAE